MAINRSVLVNPALIENMDFFNDGENTADWLAGIGRLDLAERVRAKRYEFRKGWQEKNFDTSQKYRANKKQWNIPMACFQCVPKFVDFRIIKSEAEAETIRRRIIKRYRAYLNSKQKMVGVYWLDYLLEIRPGAGYCYVAKLAGKKYVSKGRGEVYLEDRKVKMLYLITKKAIDSKNEVS